MVGVEAQVGDFGVQRRAFGRQAFEHLATVVACDQRPAAVARQAFELAFETHLEVDHEATLAHQRAVARIKHRAAAGREHQAFAPQQVGQHRGLARAEAGLTLAGNGEMLASAIRS